MPEIGRAEEWKHRMGGQKLCTVRMEQVAGTGCCVVAGCQPVSGNGSVQASVYENALIHSK